MEFSEYTPGFNTNGRKIIVNQLEERKAIRYIGSKSEHCIIMDGKITSAKIAAKIFTFFLLVEIASSDH